MANLGNELNKIKKRNAIKLQETRRRAESDIKNSGGSEMFKDQLTKGMILSPKDSRFHDVYTLYGKIFTLAAERESEEGFKTVLGMNNDPKFTKKYGPVQENWFFLQHPRTGKIVAASNFDTYAFPNKDAKTQGTLHGVYALADPAYRNLGLGSTLLGMNREYTKRFLERHSGNQNSQFKIFNEQNNPLEMTVQQYVQDTEKAGVDQADRLMFWQKRGYKPLNFGYVQPPLEEGGDPATYLTLNVVSPDGKPVPSSLVLEHLLRFAHFTVLKGKNPLEDLSFKEMKKELESKGQVSVSNPDYKGLKGVIYGLDVKPKDAEKRLVELIQPQRLRELGYK